MILIGIDFSVAKPSITIKKNNNYYFYSWPKNLSNPQKEAYKESPLIFINREDDKPKKMDSSEKMRYGLKKSQELAAEIICSINDYLKEDTIVASEGFSFGSSGDAILQLAGYKYILLNWINEKIPLENIETYAPITIKKTAGCSHKGSKKSDMIEAFLKEKNSMSTFINNNLNLFKTKKGNWIGHLDDIVDSYWTLRTLEEKLFN